MPRTTRIDLAQFAEARRLMQSSTILRLEWKLLSAEGHPFLIWVLFALFTVCGVGSGYLRVQDQAIRVAASTTNQVELIRNQQKSLAKSQRGRSASTVRESVADFRAALPLGPEALLSAGQSELLPLAYSYRKFNEDSPSMATTGGRSLSNLFADRNSVNPLRLMAGALDLGFVVVYLYPLLIIALCYDVFSRDRELGTLALALSQPISLRQFVGPQLAVRAGFTFACAIAFPAMILAVLWLSVFPKAGLVPLALWIFVASLYVAFWFLAAVFLSAKCRESMRSALSAVGLWLVLVVAVPAAVSLIADAASREDSTAEFIQSERAIRESALMEANRTQSALRAEFAKRFPPADFAPVELATARAKEPIPIPGDAGQLRKYLLANPQLASSNSLDQLLFFNQLARDADIEERLRPHLLQLERQDQSRAQLATVAGWASPAVASRMLLAEIAGTSQHRHSQFLQNIDDYVRQRDRWFAQEVAKGQPLQAGDLRKLAVFADRDEPQMGKARQMSLPAVALTSQTLLACLATVLVVRNITTLL